MMIETTGMVWHRARVMDRRSAVAKDDFLELLYKKLDRDGKRNEIFAPAPKMLWQYTDAASVTGILKDRKLSATDSRSVNDPGEVRLGKETVCAILDDELGEGDEKSGVSEWAQRLKEKMFSVIRLAEDAIRAGSDLLGTNRLEGWVLALAVSYKAQHYRDECEWRLVQDDDEVESSVELRMNRRGKIVTYREFEYKNRWYQIIEPPPIGAIRIGPRLKGGPAKQSLERLCDNVGIHGVELLESEVPYGG
jgi:hypothetical protein